VSGVQVWRSIDEARTGTLTRDGSVVSVGVFDGVHRGHQEVLAVARALADARAVPLVVLTFDPHPMAVVRPGTGPLLVSSVRRRLHLLAGCGADAVLVLPFDRDVSSMTAQAFVQAVLVDALRARVVVVGEDFRFGHRAAGDLHVLAALGLEHGFDAIGVGPVGEDGHRWSSTQVRSLVAQGDVAGAADILGHVVTVEGPVVVGDQRGRDLGYPTANLAVEPGALVPADGVYAGTVQVLDATGTDAAEPAGHPMLAAISVGTNPTFDGRERRVEAYVFDRSDLDLYGRLVEVGFVRLLRGQRRFDDVDALVRQMASDVADARAALATQDGRAERGW
jgi:riboflavin kinase/FMN adenylyltransferase